MVIILNPRTGLRCAMLSQQAIDDILASHPPTMLVGCDLHGYGYTIDPDTHQSIKGSSTVQDHLHRLTPILPDVSGLVRAIIGYRTTKWKNAQYRIPETNPRLVFSTSRPFLPPR